MISIWHVSKLVAPGTLYESTDRCAQSLMIIYWVYLLNRLEAMIATKLFEIHDLLLNVNVDAEKLLAATRDLTGMLSLAQSEGMQ